MTAQQRLTREFLEEMDRDEATAEEIAEAAGTNPIHVANRLRLLGLPVRRDRFLGVREKAERMKPIEAVDFLLGCLEKLSLVGSDRHPIDSICGELPYIQRRLAIALHDNRDSVMPIRALLAAAYFDRIEDWPEENTLRTHINTLNNRLPDHVRITRTYGRGYQMIITDHKEQKEVRA